MMKPAIQKDDHFQLAEQFVNHTRRNIFITGKAGSGKTTFLQHIRNTTPKESLIVAPTGVAAINAGGMTIHSFFQLPLGLYLPDNRPPVTGQHLSYAIHTPSELLRNLRINRHKKKLIRQLELLIIDEISMVRADLLDAVDRVLRYLRREPGQAFGGLQVLMIGDLHQLPPVVVTEEKEILEASYESPFFFSARVMQSANPLTIEFRHIFRQRDDAFLDLLNKIRNNQVDDQDMERLNRHCQHDFSPDPDQHYITLCSHHYKADEINSRELEKLPGQSYTFDAEITGNINEPAMPADTSLTLKEGAQVMFIKNDRGEQKRYYNGKIGRVSRISHGRIGIEFPEEQGVFYLEKEEWKNIRYSLDKETQSITEKVLGTFRQYPIRLAWAITIHKSQGLTFDRAIIDAEDSFTSGQVYVALSRLRSLEGLVLKTPIHRRSIITDHQLTRMPWSSSSEQLEQELAGEQEAYLKELILQSMEWDRLLDIFKEFVEEYTEKQVTYREEAIAVGEKGLAMIRELQEVSRKFKRELNTLLRMGEQGHPKLAVRMEAASNYFHRQLQEKLVSGLRDHYAQMEKRARINKYLNRLRSLDLAIHDKTMEIGRATALATGLAKGAAAGDVLRDSMEEKEASGKGTFPEKKPEKYRKGDSRKLSFEMFREGQTIDDIAHERNLAPQTVTSHLIHYISEGRLKVGDFVTPEKYDLIAREIMKNDFDSLTEIKYRLDDRFTYHEIRAVLNHLTYLKSTGQLNTG